MGFRMAALVAVSVFSVVSSANLIKQDDQHPVVGAKFYFELTAPEIRDDGLLLGMDTIAAWSVDKMPGQIRVGGAIELGDQDRQVQGSVDEVSVYGRVDLDGKILDCQLEAQNCSLGQFKAVLVNDKQVDLQAVFTAQEGQGIFWTEVTLKTDLKLGEPLDVAGLEATYLAPSCSDETKCGSKIAIQLQN